MASPAETRDHHDEGDPEIEQPSENSPLIPRHQRTDSDDATLAHQKKKPSRRRWPSLLALLFLCVLAILIIVFAFVAPDAVKEYAEQAAIFEPTSLSIDAFTSTGVRARVQGDFTMDANRVSKKSVRDIGRFCTWIAKAVESGQSDVEISLPEYGNVVLGTAHIPPIVLNIQDGHSNHVDFLADLDTGSVDGVRSIANDWIEGRLGQLRIRGKAQIPVKSGIFSFGQQTVAHEILFANNDIPAIPAYEIRKLNFREVDIPTGKGMAADVALLVQNDYPVDFTVPPLGFNILVDNCEKADPYIMIAHALTDQIHIQPHHKIEVNVTGTIRPLPDTFIQDCPGSNKSPLDVLLGRYIHGEENTVYVQGADAPSVDTPHWITDLMKDIIVPVPVPGRTFGHLIKNFSLTDTRFSLPDPLADPDTPEASPQVSGKVEAIVALPEEMNFNISVGRVRADADIFYKGNKMGKLDLHEWQQASSKRIEPGNKSEGPSLLVQSLVEDAPVHITDDDIFTEVLEQLLFGSGVILHIKAEVDVEVETALGEFAIRKVPAEGEIPIKPISGLPSSPPGKGKKPTLPPGLKPQISDLRVVNTTSSSLTLNALVNVTNPTDYSAIVPYADVHIMKNGSVIGHATVVNLTISPGRNGNINFSAIYDPLAFGGSDAKAIGKEWLSQYISGWNTTLTLQTHNASFPGLDWLGQALSKFPIEAPAPRFGQPSKDKDPEPGDPDGGDGDNDGEGSPRFIADATFHLLSSTATFLLLSPLKHTILFVDTINATALYPSEPELPSDPVTYDPVGRIEYDLPFGVPPLEATPRKEGYKTPALPVDWSLGSVGYDAVRKALGGRLRLAAYADVGIRVGEWREEVWYKGRGIGAKVRL